VGHTHVAHPVIRDEMVHRLILDLPGLSARGSVGRSRQTTRLVTVWTLDKQWLFIRRSSTYAQLCVRLRGFAALDAQACLGAASTSYCFSTEFWRVLRVLMGSVTAL